MNAIPDRFSLPPEQREHRRQRLRLAGELITGSGTRRVHILNLSPEGAQLDADEAPAMGEAVRLCRGAIDAPGTVVWIDEHRFGITFAEPILPELIDRRFSA